jgi:hypothetical protein
MGSLIKKSGNPSPPPSRHFGLDRLARDIEHLLAGWVP